MAKQPTPKMVTKKHLARMERERIQQRNLLIGTAVVLALVILLVLYGVLDQNVFQKMRPVAQVGNQTLGTGDFQLQVRYTRMRMIDTLQQFAGNSLYQQYFGSYITQLQTQLDPTNSQQLGQQVLTQMIEDSVIAQEAAKLGVTVSDAEIDRQIQENFGYYVKGTPSPTLTATTWMTYTPNATELALVPPTATPTITPTGPTPTSSPTVTATGPTPTQGTTTPTETSTPVETATTAPTATSTPAGTLTPTLTNTPAPTNTPYTEAGYKKNYDDYLNSLKSIGFGAQQLRALVKAQLLREKITQLKTKDVQPVQDQVWARHILVATEADAKKARDRLMKGESFATVAKDMSTDTSNKDTGGDLGWFTADKMVKEFSDAAFALKPGEISQPVKSSFGYHIIQVIGHEKRPLTSDQLATAKQTAFQNWLTAQEKALNMQQLDHWKEVIPTDPVVPPELAATQVPQQQNPLVPSGPN